MSLIFFLFLFVHIHLCCCCCIFCSSFHAHLPFRHLLSNRDFEQCSPRIGLFAYYEYIYYTYIESLALREYAHNEYQHTHMWTIGMANCRLHIFTFSNGMLKTRFQHTYTLVSRSTSIAYYSIVRRISMDLVSNTAHTGNNNSSNTKNHFRRLKSAIPPVM